MLVVGRLNDITDHQHAAFRYGGLGIVALLEAAACNRHDARLLIRQIDLIGWQRGPGVGGWGGVPPGFLPVCLSLGLARRLLRLCSACSRSKRSWARASIFVRASAIFFRRSSRRASSSGIESRPAGQLYPRLRPWPQLPPPRPSTALDLARVLIGQRAVAAGIGVDLRAIQPDRAQLEHAHLARQQQHLHEQRFDLLSGNRRRNVSDGVMVGVFVRRDEAEGHQSYVACSSLRLENTPVA